MSTVIERALFFPVHDWKERADRRWRKLSSQSPQLYTREQKCFCIQMRRRKRARDVTWPFQNRGLDKKG